MLVHHREAAGPKVPCPAPPPALPPASTQAGSGESRLALTCRD